MKAKDLLLPTGIFCAGMVLGIALAAGARDPARPLASAAPSPPRSSSDETDPTHGNIEEAAEARDPTDGLARQRLRPQAYRHWASTDPAAAAALTLETEPEELRPAVVGAIMAEWARLDPAAAGAWVGNLPAGPVQRTAIESLLSAWSGTDPAAVSSFVAAMPGGDFTVELAARLATAWGRQDVGAAVSWARSLREGPVREASIGVLLTVWAERDPVTALECALGLPVDARNGDPAAVVVELWAGRDPTGATRWIHRQPEPIQGRLLAVMRAAPAPRSIFPGP